MKYFLFSVTILSFGACPADDKQGDPTTQTTVLPDTVELDSTTVEPDSSTTSEDGTAPTTTDASATDVGGDTTVEEGKFGWPCEGNEQCDSGYCLEGYVERVCSERCQTDCPDGWSCRRDLAATSDNIFVCVQTFPNLCRPCDTNAQCEADASPGSRCLPRGDDGSFCGGACTVSSCPDGYSCKPSVDVDGNVSPQCVPDDDAECTCSPRAVAQEATTTCREVDLIGTCLGERQCTAAGLTSCDAATPSEDVCNGVDDNCDGQTDELHLDEPCLNTNSFGSCPGTSVCEGADGERCDGPIPQAEKCDDNVDSDCDGTNDDEDAQGCTSFWIDLDGDQVGTGAPKCLCGPLGDFTATVDGDCDDNQGTVHPNAPEVCDGLDNDCDDQTDNEGSIGCSIYYRDGDDDSFGDPNDFECLCAADPAHDYTSLTGSDCDDQQVTVNPSAPETCDTRDNDCDTLVDEEGAIGCSFHFADLDADDWGDPLDFACLCAPEAAYPVTQGGDCDDDEERSNPGLDEACDDAIDNDCDGQTDEANALGCDAYHRDSDGDDYGSAESRCLCKPEAPFDVVASGDCDDNAVAINPGAVEKCNGRDDNCDQVVDNPGAQGCSQYFRDNDLDSYGQDGDSQCLCQAEVPYGAVRGLDCDDDSPFVNPSAAEVCNQVDDNCNESTDEGVTGTCSPFFYDGDDDGWGLANDSRCLCGPDGLYRAVKAGDCDDTVASTYPFAAESCNGVDDDCDAATDEAGAVGCNTFYQDLDHDQVGASANPQCLCGASEPFTATVGGDCNESDPAVKPGVTEACNDKDDDCDGIADPPNATGCHQYLRDSDRDGYGLANDTLCICDAVAPYSATLPGDCNDADASISPADPEVCNGKDDDCTNVADDPGTAGCIIFYRDDDGDAFGKDSDSRCLCAPSGAYRATSGGDCDDGKDNVNPALTELCNGFDDDCDTQVDEQDAVGCTAYLKDTDGDAYGVDGDFRCLCAAGPIYRATQGGDCDDNRTIVHKNATELCDTFDNDCDGVNNEQNAQGCTSYLADVDNDGYGKTGDARCYCAPTGNYRVTVGGDCNDGSTLVSPAATEFCNGTDDDCDQATDEANATGCQQFYVDADTDQWGTGAGQCLCKATGAFVTSQAGDCADNDANRNPGKPEICAGGQRDEDCDNVINEANAGGCSDFYTDVDDDDYGVTLSKECLCAATGTKTATVGGDCKDADDLVNPGETEICNAKDDDCDGLVDEGCGLLSATGAWPTSKYDRRRSGWGSPFNGPMTKTLRWKRQFNANIDIQTSPVFDGNGRMYIVINSNNGSVFHRLNPANGQTVWQLTMPAQMSASAGPTLRNGQTAVVPTGNGLTMVNLNDGTQIWDVRLPGTNAEPLTGSPMVDNEGVTYVAGFSAAYAIDAGGNVKWSVPVPNQEYVMSHTAWSPTNDRLYFGCSNHTLFAVTRAGQIAWTYVVLGQDVDASSAIRENGDIWQSFGSTYHAVRDDGNVATALGNVNTGGDNDSPPTIWKDSGGTEHVISNANSNSGLRSYNAGTRALEWTFAMTKDGSINTTPAIDKNGRVYVGDDAAHFQCVNASGTGVWSFGASDGLTGAEIQTTVALQEKAVFFGDSSGTVYCIADP